MMASACAGGVVGEAQEEADPWPLVAPPAPRGLRTDWRSVPCGPRAAIADLIGERPVHSASQGKAVRRVHAEARVTLVPGLRKSVTSSLLDALELQASGSPHGDRAALEHALATQDAFTGLKIERLAPLAVEVVGAALGRNNPNWRRLVVGARRVFIGQQHISLTPVLAGLAGNHTLQELALVGRMLAPLTAEQSHALGAALAASGCALQRLHLESCVDAHPRPLMLGLARNRSLRELEIHLRGPCLEVGEVLREVLREQLVPLEKLGVHHQLGDAAGALLAQGLASNAVLRELCLHSCRLGHDTAASLGQALGFKRSALRKLHVTTNRGIDDAAGAQLARGLADNEVLQDLSLGHCGVGVATATALADALRSERCGLRKLDLDFSLGMADVGCAALAQGLVCNSVLRELRLGQSGVGALAVAAFARALASERTALRELNLSGNMSIRDEGALALAQVLASNAALRGLDLRGCSVSAQAAAQVAEAAKRPGVQVLVNSFGAPPSTGHAVLASQKLPGRQLGTCVDDPGASGIVFGRPFLA